MKNKSLGLFFFFLTFVFLGQRLFALTDLIELQGGFNTLGMTEAEAAKNGNYARVTNTFDSAWKFKNAFLLDNQKLAFGLEVMFLNREIRYAQLVGVEQTNYFVRHTPLLFSVSWYLAGYEAPASLVLSMAGGVNAEHYDVKLLTTTNNRTISTGIQSSYFQRVDLSLRPGIEFFYRIHEHSRFVLSYYEFFTFENTLKSYPVFLVGLEFSIPFVKPQP